MIRRYKSGAQKRKEQALREHNNFIAQRKQPLITDFDIGQKAKSVINEPSEQAHRNDDENCVSSDQKNESSAIEMVLLTSSNQNKMVTTEDCEMPNQDSSSVIYVCGLNDFDTGSVETDFFNPQAVDKVIRQGHQEMPNIFPRDRLNELFPISLLYKHFPNGEKLKRDWLVWSCIKSAFFCLPCRLFSHKTMHRPLFSSPVGYSKLLSWKKCYDKIPAHENSDEHIQCYLKWREREKLIQNESSIENMFFEQIKDETMKWKLILKRILDTILFLGERGLALRGDSQRVGDSNNGNFLGILELIAHYDPILHDHLEKVKSSQKTHQRLQVHYLSSDIQNEFIDVCARHVISIILKEREIAKYYSIIVGATPDSAHIEQTTFILRYLRWIAEEKKYTVEERFLAFVDCNKKTGQAIADLINSTLKTYKIPLNECRGQGYDNGSNMKGVYKGAQSIILKDNPLADYSPCAGHSLNLCGVDSAECCVKAITFFGVVQKCYCLFSCSPQRWEILKKHIGSSPHCLSDTRWSARIDAVKPFANHLPGIQNALEELKSSLNLTAVTRRDIYGILTYIRKFECVLMASIWYKILSVINERSTVLQARKATIDVEVANLKSLIEDLQFIREQWDSILLECIAVASGLKDTSNSLPATRKRKRVNSENSVDYNSSDENNDFKINTFLMIVDSVIEGISDRFKAINSINESFSFLWNFSKMNERQIQQDATKFINKYAVDVSQELENEVIHLKHVFEDNFETGLSPLELLNAIMSKNLHNLFPNICIALRIFCTLPVSVASGERSFSTLSRIKNAHRSCSTQTRLSGLGTLCLEAELAKSLNFDDLINDFASLKARKAFIK